MKKYIATSNSRCFNCGELIREGDNLYINGNRTLCLHCAFFLVIVYIYEGQIPNLGFFSSGQLY